MSKSVRDLEINTLLLLIFNNFILTRQQQLEKLLKHLLSAEERKFLDNFLLVIMPEMLNSNVST